MSKNFLSAPVAEFPAAGSQQRIAAETSKNRNKVALKPGRSLMDWIRLGASGKDLTGIGGKILTITPQELEKHNKIDDAWTCLRGKVYNITQYMEFHPGGIDELMRAAGRDGTELFDEVHKWVNFESMLQKCYVGKMKAVKLPVKGTSGKMAAPSSGSVLSKLLPKKPLTKANLMESSLPLVEKDTSVTTSATINEKCPKFDWYQSESNIHVTIYTYRNDTICVSDVVVFRSENNFHVGVLMDNKKFIVHVELHGKITGNPCIKVQESTGKIEIVLTKADPKVHWTTIGKPLENHGQLVFVKDCRDIYMNCTLVDIATLTHDTKLLTLTLPEGSFMIVPVGHHIHLRYDIQGMEMVRSYTVVTPDLTSKHQPDGLSLHLLIKIYKDGVLTPVIDAFKIRDTVSISQYVGTFRVGQIRNVRELNLFAAGTGITPMIGLINHVINVPGNDCKILLKFYNKTEQDIIWHDQLDSLQQNNDNFSVQYCLSEASEEWVGKKGRVTADDVEALVSNKLSFLCACGPTAFTNAVMAMAKEKGYTDDNCHAFLG